MYGRFKSVSAEARYMAARSKHLEGDNESALKNYRIVIKDYPGSGWADRAAKMIKEIEKKR